MPPCMGLNVSPFWGQEFALWPLLPLDSRCIGDFPVCSAFYLLLGGGSDFQAPSMQHQEPWSSLFIFTCDL